MGSLFLFFLAFVVTLMFFYHERTVNGNINILFALLWLILLWMLLPVFAILGLIWVASVFYKFKKDKR